MQDELFERIMVPLAGPEDADQTARALRPHLESNATLVVTHVIGGATTETTVETGRDQFAEATYETFSTLLDRDDLRYEWVTVAGREVAEALVDAVGMTDVTLVAFTPRDLDAWSRTITGDPGGRLIRESDVPLMVFPDA